MVDAGDAELACTAFGAGSPVLWLHGSGPGAAGMSNFRANLSAFGDYRNLVVDLPWWGRSPRPGTDDPLLVHAAERACRAMEAPGIERAHLVGNSYGGGVTMRIAMAHRDRVDRLVLTAPGGVLPADAPPWPVGFDHLFGYMAAGKPSREAMAGLVRLMMYDQALATDALIDERYESSLRVRPELPIPRKFGDLTPGLARIGAPTLLVWGREDQTVPLTWASTILAGVPDAELRVLPHCRHWVQYERAPESNHIVREFLQGGAAAATSEG
ncbi:alpha/beta fold hydrolase [Pseudonocardia alaniniphila]|uniref:Alpha/beta fold hydrolase n=1 Tax=Pseudonocardia alaniniphila TaxID=75291 RepID=A0ABS9TU40_9PSEU|nr:alpha/beta fold hydrolase [Pseudonocardia alaniniphila]MCH6171863.1 alpha/beta fold hydrolase [Pseudonocardia alaniniphila]